MSFETTTPRSPRPSARGEERTFRTDGGPPDATGMFVLEGGQVRDLPVSIDYVKLTSEGKLQIALVGEAVRGGAREDPGSAPGDDWPAAGGLHPRAGGAAPVSRRGE